MTLHPQCEEVLRRVAAWGEVASMDVAAARALEQRRMRELAARGPEVAEIADRSVPGPDGAIPVRIYRPADAHDGVLVWLHGGGWVLGTLDGTDEHCRALADAAGCVVVSVDYRLAPEHPFPTGLEDCYAAAAWVAAHPRLLGLDAPRVAVGGDSAGGNLAAAVTLLARERGGPQIDFQMLVYPATSAACDTPSHERCGSGYWLTREALAWCWGHYLARAEDGASPYASPLRAASLAGLPPAFVVTAQYDPLCDEGEQYAGRLRAAGVPARVRRYDGMLHGFMACAAVVDRAWDAFAECGAALHAAQDPTRHSR